MVVGRLLELGARAQRRALIAGVQAGTRRRSRCGAAGSETATGRAASARPSSSASDSRRVLPHLEHPLAPQHRRGAASRGCRGRGRTSARAAARRSGGRRTPASPRTSPPRRWRRASPARFSVGRSAQRAGDRQQRGDAGGVVVRARAPCRATRCRPTSPPTPAVSDRARQHQPPAPGRRRPARPPRRAAYHGQHQRRARVDALEQPGQQPVDPLRQSRDGKKSPTVGASWWASEDDRPLGVRRAHLGDDVRGLALGAAACRRRLRRGGRSSTAAAAAARAERRRRSRAGRAARRRRRAAPAAARQAQRPPVGPVESSSISIRACAPCSASRATSHSAARRSPSRGARAVDRRQRLDLRPAATSPSSHGARVDRCDFAAVAMGTGNLPRAARGRPPLPNMEFMPAGCGLTLFRVWGIRIAVDFSWFFVLFLVILWLSDFYRGRARQLDGGGRPLPPGADQRAALLRLDPAPRARPRLGRRSATGSGSPTSRCGCSAASRGSSATRTPRRPSSRSRSRGRSSRSRSSSISGALGIAFAGGCDFYDAMMVEEGAQISGRARGDRVADEHQPAGAGVQPDPRLPARRRPRRASGRVAGHGRSQQRHAVRGHPGSEVRLGF